eukprot:6479020-Amphidinium_carterae.1
MGSRASQAQSRLHWWPILGSQALSSGHGLAAEHLAPSTGQQKVFLDWPSPSVFAVGQRRTTGWLLAVQLP